MDFIGIDFLWLHITMRAGDRVSTCGHKTGYRIAVLAIAVFGVVAVVSFFVFGFSTNSGICRYSF